MGRLGARRTPLPCMDGYKSVSVPLRLFDISEIGNRPPQWMASIAVECCPNLKPSLGVSADTPMDELWREITYYGRGPDPLG